MSAKMTVVYLEHTGHVLAALREPLSGAPKLEALVGAAFPLRSVRNADAPTSAALFDVPPSLLKAKSIALDERVIGRPHGFAIDGDQVAELPPPLAGFDVPALDQATVTIDYGANPAAEAKVLSFVRGQDSNYREQRIQAGKIPTTARQVALNLAIVPTGPEAGLQLGAPCDVGVAIAGFPLVYFEETV